MQFNCLVYVRTGSRLVRKFRIETGRSLADSGLSLRGRESQESPIRETRAERNLKGNSEEFMKIRFQRMIVRLVVQNLETFY